MKNELKCAMKRTQTLAWFGSQIGPEQRANRALLCNISQPASRRDNLRGTADQFRCRMSAKTAQPLSK